MKKNIPTVAILACLLAVIQVPSTLSWAQTPPAASPKGVASSLQPFIDNHVLAGAVTLVASKAKILSLEAVGYAEIAAKKPMQTDNLFWIASMTKPMTATALMMLVDEGKVNVDDPVEKYLPEFKGQMLQVGDGRGKAVLKKPAHPITVRNLLTHTSGLCDGAPWGMPSLQAAVAHYAASPLKFEPGSKFEYNNPGINTVGRIIEVVSGMPYDEFMARRLFQPLGMTDTTFWPTPSQVQRLAKTYKPSADRSGLEATSTLPFVERHTGRKLMPFPAGGLFSTATDVSQFCRMILNDGVLNEKRYLSEKSLQQMTSTQTGSLPVAYGFGWFTDRQPGGSFGHGGAHKTDMHIFPQQQLVTVFMVQNTDWRNGDGGKVLPTFQQAAIRAFGITPYAQAATTPAREAKGPQAPSLPNLNALSDAEKAAGWKLVFDGKTLKGWHASAQTGHSRASGNKSGGRWVAENGMIVGSQDIPGNGGILLTDEKFGDYEIALEMKNDFGPDSGLFLRCDEKGNCYQAMIDYHVGGNLMGLYGEGNLGAKPSVRNFTFLDRPDHIELVTESPEGPVPVPFPMPLEDWPKFWKHGQWNELRARIVGNPPHITTWIKGVKFMDWTEPMKRHPDKGSIGLQVHGGGDFTRQYVRYRNLRIKPLNESK